MKKFNEDNKIKWDSLNQNHFNGILQRWDDSLILITYDTIYSKVDLFEILDCIRRDEKTLQSKYPQIKYKINIGIEYGDVPFIEIED